MSYELRHHDAHVYLACCGYYEPGLLTDTLWEGGRHPAPVEALHLQVWPAAVLPLVAVPAPVPGHASWAWYDGPPGHIHPEPALRPLTLGGRGRQQGTAHL